MVATRVSIATHDHQQREHVEEKMTFLRTEQRRVNQAIRHKRTQQAE